MKLVKLRLTNRLATINEDEWSVKFRSEESSIGFLIEVRVNRNMPSAYITASLACDDKILDAGAAVHSYAEFDLYQQVSTEAFTIAKGLKVARNHVWPLIEQFPAFSDSGVKISDAVVFETPIRDLMALGATQQEIMSSLGIPRELLEFVTGTRTPCESPRLVGTTNAVPREATW